MGKMERLSRPGHTRDRLVLLLVLLVMGIAVEVGMLVANVEGVTATFILPTAIVLLVCLTVQSARRAFEEDPAA